MANRETALQYIHEHPTIYLQKARVDGYICPICGSGSGPNGTGITTKDGRHFTCWGKGRCYTSVDIPDIIALKEGLQPGGAEALQRAYELYGIPVDAGGTGPRPTIEQDFGPPAQATAAADPPAAAQDLSAFYGACHDRIGQTDYPQQRGLSQAVMERYRIGYDPAWRSPTALKNGHNPPASPRLIIPTGPNSYIARDTRAELTDEQGKYRKMKEGPALAFNLQAIEQAAGPIFIVEGEIDALSVIQAGGEAIGLGGTSGINQLLCALERGKPQQPLILALDKDEPGQKAEKDLLAGLDKLGIPYTQADIAGAHKDPNAALMADRISFSLAVLDAQQAATAVQAAAQEAATAEQEAAREAAAAAQEAERQAYMNTSAAGYMAAFKGQIAASVDTKPMRTGFTYLDGFMDGGLYEGLYCIGGGTSTGKTTLALQIADNIAASGTDVLIFSLEMARYELMARSISRLTLVNSLLNKTPTSDAKTTRDILSGARHQQYSKTETDLYNRALAEYETFAAEHIYISEGIGDIGVKQIRETIGKHLTFTGNRPFVVVDYLQLLAPHDPRATDKQNTDKAVLELKRISRDFKIPVMAVSSLNRASYSNSIDLEAFKESGAIEYSSDVLLGLQYEGNGGKSFDKTTASQARQRKMELKILKQRNAPTGMSVTFDYYSFANYYHETGMKQKASPSVRNE